MADADLSWIRDLEHIFKYGNRVSPRGLLVYESIAYMSVVSMENPIIFNKHRKLGYRFMAAEAAWILDGKDDVASIIKYSKEIAKFSDDGISFYGAYGPRLGNQAEYVVSALMKDIDTRQAVATVWRRNPGPTKDVPCTVALQWLVRHGSIHCVATMRSSDLWLGHPYDIFNFSAVTFALMLQINNLRHQQGEVPLVLGKLFLTAGSKHIYDKNAADVGTIIGDFHENGLPKVNRTSCFDSSVYDDPQEFVQHLWAVADSPAGALSLMKFPEGQGL